MKKKKHVEDARTMPFLSIDSQFPPPPSSPIPMPPSPVHIHMYSDGKNLDE
jgi:hypothetical protein